ncbi:MAG: hypothetical protein ACI4VF_03470 [Lachnospirales bacterium]
MFNTVSLIVGFLSSLIAIIIFNMVTAFTALLLGDDTPKKNGFLSINPKNQVDFLGYILFAVFGYGWSQPVEIRAGNFKDRKKGTIITFAFPIVFSILLAEILYAFTKITGAASLLNTSGYMYYIWYFIYSIPHYILKLALVNIIPVYPFWGSNILKAVINPNSAFAYAQRERIIQMVIIFLILLGVVSTPLNIVVNLLLGW